MEPLLKKNHAEQPEEWMPVGSASCLNCWWNWHESNPLPTASCHLLPRQVQLIGGNQIAAVLPPLGDERAQSRGLCSCWKSREPENG